MMGTEMVPERLSFNQLTQLIAQENFINELCILCKSAGTDLSGSSLEVKVPLKTEVESNTLEMNHCMYLLLTNSFYRVPTIHFKIIVFT
jgi:hypothetical protein